MIARANAPIEVHVQEAPQIGQSFNAMNLEAPREPVRPREPVKTGVMTPGVPHNTENSVAKLKVQTGQFGDVGAPPLQPDRDQEAASVRLGSLDIPLATRSGNGTAAMSRIDGAVGSSGFGTVTTIPAGPISEPQQEVRSAGFATVTVGEQAERPEQNVQATAAIEPVVILEKPNPMYSEEARRLGIEGEVQVQAVFLASGSVRVVSVSKGLGHGLDEAAMRATRQIRFRPARREGRVVDFPATVRIEFQLAF
jgi:TonB family protein